MAFPRPKPKNWSYSSQTQNPTRSLAPIFATTKGSEASEGRIPRSVFRRSQARSTRSSTLPPARLPWPKWHSKTPRGAAHALTIHMHIHTQTYVYTHIHIHVYIYIYMYIYLLPPKLVKFIVFQKNDRCAFLVLKFQHWCHKTVRACGADSDVACGESINCGIFASCHGPCLGLAVGDTVRKAFKTRSQTVRMLCILRKYKKVCCEITWCSERYGA